MKFSSFISYVNNPAEAESSFQFIIPLPQKYIPSPSDDFFDIRTITIPTGEVNLAPKDLERELENFFYKSLFEEERLPSHCEGMLEFHFQKYPGVKSDFLSFITHSIRMKEMHARGTFRDRPYFTSLHRQSLKQTVIEWVDKKKQELESGEIIIGSMKRSYKKTVRLINYINRVEIDIQKQMLIDALKMEFKGSIGKEIAFMILLLEDYGILDRRDWKRMELYRSLLLDFKDIGAWQGIFNNWMTRGFLKNEVDKFEYDAVRKRVKTCLDKAQILL